MVRWGWTWSVADRVYLNYVPSWQVLGQVVEF